MLCLLSRAANRINYICNTTKNEPAWPKSKSWMDQAISKSFASTWRSALDRLHHHTPSQSQTKCGEPDADPHCVCRRRSSNGAAKYPQAGQRHRRRQRWLRTNQKTWIATRESEPCPHSPPKFPQHCLQRRVCQFEPDRA